MGDDEALMPLVSVANGVAAFLERRKPHVRGATTDNGGTGCLVDKCNL